MINASLNARQWRFRVTKISISIGIIYTFQQEVESDLTIVECYGVVCSVADNRKVILPRHFLAERGKTNGWYFAGWFIDHKSLCQSGQDGGDVAYPFQPDKSDIKMHFQYWISRTVAVPY